MYNESVANKVTQRPGAKKQPATREPKKKKTLKEVASDLMTVIADQDFEDRLRQTRERQKVQEDEVLTMMFGPSSKDENPALTRVLGKCKALFVTDCMVIKV